ncbi:MAG: hypothetical protein ABF632_12645, partial [Gluconobacter japonicus]
LPRMMNFWKSLTQPGVCMACFVSLIKNLSWGSRRDAVAGLKSYACINPEINGLRRSRKVCFHPVGLSVIRAS